MAANPFYLVAIWLTAAALVQSAETAIPQGHTPERYERIWKKSPFTVASVIAPTATDTTTFADSLTLVGLVTMGGKPLVTVVANDSQETSLVEADRPNAAGLQVVSFTNDLDPSKVEVVLKKGDVSGTLHFTINETPAPPPNITQPVNPDSGQPRRIIQPRVINGNIPAPAQPRVLPRTSGPVVPGLQGGNPAIRRRQLQLPGPNRVNQTNGQPQKTNVIPPP